MNSMNSTTSMINKKASKPVIANIIWPFSVLIGGGLNGISASVDGNNVVVVGSAQAPGTLAVVLTSSDLGRTFVSGTQNLLCTKVTISGARVVVIGKLTSSGPNKYWLSSDYGVTFTMSPTTTSPAIGDARGRISMSGANAVRGDYFGNIVYSSNYGQDWSLGRIVPGNASYGSWWDVFIYGTRAIACQYTGRPASGMYYSSNSGQTWTKSTSAAANKDGFVACAMFGQYAVATTFVYGNYQGIIYSSDYGVTWSNSLINTAQYLYFDGSICINNTSAYALTSFPAGYVYSNNNGATWNYSTTSTQGMMEISISGDQLFAPIYGSNILTIGTKPF
jgi:hypothetical protein